MLRNFTPAVLIGILFLSCHKQSGAPALFTVKGQVVDTATHRVLSNVKVYLAGGSSYLGAVTYDLPELDSAVTDAHGNFVLQHTTQTSYGLYALTVEVATQDGYRPQPNCYPDSYPPGYSYPEPYILFYPVHPGSDAPVTVYARAVGLTRLNLKVDSNPYDTLVLLGYTIATPGAAWSEILTGPSVDTTFWVPTQPLVANTIQVAILTVGLRDSVNPGLNMHRMDEYTVTPGALDTPVLNVRYASAYDIKL